MQVFYRSHELKNFKVGDVVRKFVSERISSPYTGIVTRLMAGQGEVLVEWPWGSEQEDPSFLFIDPKGQEMGADKLAMREDTSQLGIAPRREQWVNKSASHKDTEISLTGSIDNKEFAALSHDDRLDLMYGMGAEVAKRVNAHVRADANYYHNEDIGSYVVDFITNSHVEDGEYTLPYGLELKVRISEPKTNWNTKPIEDLFIDSSVIDNVVKRGMQKVAEEDDVEIHSVPKKGAPRMDIRKYYHDDDVEDNTDTDMSLSEKNASEIKNADAEESIDFDMLVKDFEKWIYPEDVFEHRGRFDSVDVSGLDGIQNGDKNAVYELANDLYEKVTDYTWDIIASHIDYFLKENDLEFADVPDAVMDELRDIAQDKGINFNWTTRYDFEIMLRRYVTGDDMDFYGSDDSSDEDIEEVKEMLRSVSKGSLTESQIDSMVAEASYGGSVYIGVVVNASDMIEAVLEGKNTITGNQTLIGIHDAFNGSGDMEFVNMSYNMPLDKDTILDQGSYSVGAIFGMGWNF